MGTGGAALGLFFLILVIAITVAISRWVFRINDIVERLDNIVKRLEHIYDLLSKKG